MSVSKMLGLFAATALLVLGGTARAADELLPTEIVFGQPGVVYFDATNVKKLFPLPDEIRSFSTEADFYRFLETDLNAVIHFDQNGDVEDVELEVVTLDHPVYFDVERKVFQDIPSSYMYFVGGRSGFYVVGTDLLCVNPYLCGDIEPSPNFGKVPPLPVYDFTPPAPPELKITASTERSTTSARASPARPTRSEQRRLAARTSSAT